MLPVNLDSIPDPLDSFNSLEVYWMTVPALGGSDSGLLIGLADAKFDWISLETQR